MIANIIAALALTPVFTLVLLYIATRAEVTEPSDDPYEALYWWMVRDSVRRGYAPAYPGTYADLGFEPYCVSLELYLRMQMDIPPSRVDEQDLFDLDDCLSRLL